MSDTQKEQESQKPKEEPEFINAHTHLFNADDTPTYLARKFVVWPFYYLIDTRWAIYVLKKYRKWKSDGYSYSARNRVWNEYLTTKSTFMAVIRRLFLLMVNLLFFFYLLYVLEPLLQFHPLESWLEWLYGTSFSKYLLVFPERVHYLSLLLLMFLLFKKLRNWFLQTAWNNIKRRLGKEWVEFMLRYRNILFYAGYASMKNMFNKLHEQYPPNTGFVVLPMDMEFMGAGKVKRSYMEQMQELLQTKNDKDQTMYPFLFAHPRRMTQTIDGKPYFSGRLVGGTYELEDCHVKDFLDQGCSGIKIYPALGYYPFDKNLLALWLYCDQNQIPITTHCSVGPIFYRGNLKKLDIRDIDRHPVFDQIVGKTKAGEEVIEKLRLPLYKNKIFQRNFTHPLNYMCLLHEPFLKKVLDYHQDPELNALFGYNREDKSQKLANNLSNLKINLAHYGGSENWDEFLEKDRYREANKIINQPEIGLDLTKNMDNLTKLYSTWHFVDWFSLISSMILNFENVYTDISYTAHDLKYLNLLSKIMDNPEIGKRVLFGTDFYVVSNHKSEKHFWIDMQNTLGKDRWRLLSCDNPKNFLKSSWSTSKTTAVKGS